MTEIQNQLPRRYKSWIHFMDSLKEIDTKGHRYVACNENGEIYRIEIDYAKARAFEELGTIPDIDQLRDVYRAIHFSSPVPKTLEALDFINNLIKLRL